MINPFNKKKGLGRGLSSLIGDNDVIKNNGTKEEFIKLLEDVHTKYLMIADND